MLNAQDSYLVVDCLAILLRHPPEFVNVIEHSVHLPACIISRSLEQSSAIRGGRHGWREVSSVLSKGLGKARERDFSKHVWRMLLAVNRGAADKYSGVYVVDFG